jgi:CubicO group peptidase (beta-lactamase class C family)
MEGPVARAAVELDRLLTDDERAGRFAGAVRLEERGRAVLDAAYGTADRSSRRGVATTSSFQIASVSKQFAAAAVLLLDEAGTISTEDPVSRWIEGCPDAWRPVTIHHLLTHTSGLPHWRDLPALDVARPATDAALLEAFASVPLKFPPGEGWAYSSPGYQLLARIVERASGDRYSSFLRRRIFEPLRMTRTAAGSRPPAPDDVALGYAAGVAVPSFELDTVGRGAGDLWSTTGDLARWDRALADPDRLLSRRSLDRTFTPHVALPREETSNVPSLEHAAYGYGWYLARIAGTEVRFHSGDNPGYRALNLWVPNGDVVLCLLSNSEETDVGRIALRVLRELRPR